MVHVGGDEVERKFGSWMSEESVLRVWGNPTLFSFQFTLFSRQQGTPPSVYHLAKRRPLLKTPRNQGWKELFRASSFMLGLGGLHTFSVASCFLSSVLALFCPGHFLSWKCTWTEIMVQRTFGIPAVVWCQSEVPSFKLLRTLLRV